MILECNNLNKSIGKKQILNNISFNVNEGDLLAFVGPNGAGKTTTIKLILGLQKITSGSVKINGFDIEKNFEKAISKVGAIIESPDMYMYLTGYQNLKLVARMYKNITDERIKECIKLAGLENRINDKVSKYSLGMRQRLGIAQAILHKPNLLILDEPTNGLDPEGIKNLRELLVNLAKKEKMGILISSHNLSELENFCNKVVMIKNGKIVESSSIEEAKQFSGKMEYLIEVDNVEKAQKLLKDFKETNTNNKIENSDTNEIKLNDEIKNTIEIYTEKEKIPDILKKLIENDVKIYKVYEKNSLEDAYLRKLGGNIIE